MPSRPQPKHRATRSVLEAHELIAQAGAAVRRARAELRGDPERLAARLAVQLGFMSEVAELLAHEIERAGGRLPTSSLALLPGGRPLQASEEETACERPPG
jgi:hypothetical protein